MVNIKSSQMYICGSTFQSEKYFRKLTPKKTQPCQFRYMCLVCIYHEILSHFHTIHLVLLLREVSSVEKCIFASHHCLKQQPTLLCNAVSESLQAFLSFSNSCWSYYPLITAEIRDRFNSILKNDFDDRVSHSYIPAL